MTGEIISPWATLAFMQRQMDVAVWKDASNVRPYRKEELVIAEYKVKLWAVGYSRRQSTHT